MVSVSLCQGVFVVFMGIGKRKRGHLSPFPFALFIFCIFCFIFPTLDFACRRGLCFFLLDNVFVSFLFFPCYEIGECVVIDYAFDCGVEFFPETECGARFCARAVVFFCFEAVYRCHASFCQSQNVADFILFCTVFEKIAALCSPKASDVPCFCEYPCNAFQIFDRNSLPCGYVFEPDWFFLIMESQIQHQPECISSFC